MDYLKQLVDDYTNGIVDLEGTLNRLDFLDWTDNKKPLPQDYQREPRNPLDIIVENERLEGLCSEIVELKKKLSKENWAIVTMISKGYTTTKIGNILGISHQAVSKRIATIRRIAEPLREYLVSEPSTFEASTPSVKIEYPMDAARKNHRHCEMPEYLRECFHDDKTLCSYCEKCTRKKDNQ